MRSGGFLGPLRDQRAHAGDLATQDGEAGWVFELTALLLHAQVDGFQLEFATTIVEFFNGEFAQFFDFHDRSCSRRLVSGCTGDKTRAKAHFVGSQAAGLTGGSLVNAGDFEKHVTRKDNCNPEFRGAFTLTHTCFWRTGGNGFVWEDADENLPLTLEVTGDRNAARFDLVVLDPAAIKRLESELAEVEFVAAAGGAGATATLGLAVFCATRKKSHDLKGLR